MCSSATNFCFGLKGPACLHSEVQSHHDYEATDDIDAGELHHDMLCKTESRKDVRHDFPGGRGGYDLVP